MAQGTSPWSWSKRETTTGSEPVTLGLDASDVARYNTPRCLAGWCNGSTTDSGSVSEGSNPSPAAPRNPHLEGFFFVYHPHEPSPGYGKRYGSDRARQDSKLGANLRPVDRRRRSRGKLTRVVDLRREPSSA